MKVTIDDRSGFCFGVVGAIARAEESLAQESGEVYCLGDIVHNRSEVDRLEALGLHTLQHAALPSLHGATLLIRAHGEPPATYALAKKNGLRLIDATCPVVARLQKRVAKAYAQMEPVGGQVVILGKRGHAEVVGLTGQIGGQAIVIEGLKDLENRKQEAGGGGTEAGIDFSRPIYLLSQTTQSLRLFEQVRDQILRRAADEAQVVVRDTICRQVAGREAQIADFARRFDVVLFVAGRKSSNGQLLFEECLRANPRSHLIENASEIDPEWLSEAGSVGICGATSTPQWLMEQVAGALRARNKEKGERRKGEIRLLQNPINGAKRLR